MNVPDDWACYRHRCRRCGSTYHESGAESCACDEEWEQWLEKLSDVLAQLAAFEAGDLIGRDWTEGAWLGIHWAEVCGELEDIQRREPRRDA